MIRRLALIVALAVAATARSAEVLDNTAIIRMVHAGLSPEIIVLKIDQSEARFDLSTDALVELKTAGVADAVIKAMMLKAPRATPAAAAALPAPSTSVDAWLSMDEQSFALADLTVQCIEPEARIAILGTSSGGDATWRFSDGKESFELRGKPDEVHKLSGALATAAPAVRHGKCSESALRTLLRANARSR